MKLGSASALSNERTLSYGLIFDFTAEISGVLPRAQVFGWAPRAMRASSISASPQWHTWMMPLLGLALFSSRRKKSSLCCVAQRASKWVPGTRFCRSGSPPFRAASCERCAYTPRCCSEIGRLGETPASRRAFTERGSRRCSARPRAVMGGSEDDCSGRVRVLSLSCGARLISSWIFSLSCAPIAWYSSTASHPSYDSWEAQASPAQPYTQRVRRLAAVPPMGPPEGRLP
mmetsp:Transcript_21748/g.64831  ORF Transcript_21748/g.64831 Transcript_21748/m.64831 type:complete len:230 (-) Transcript_21748:92-781(-)